MCFGAAAAVGSVAMVVEVGGIRLVRDGECLQSTPSRLRRASAGRDAFEKGSSACRAAVRSGPH